MTPYDHYALAAIFVAIVGCLIWSAFKPADDHDPHAEPHGDVTGDGRK